ncbi:MAG TPA: hypothetical protein VHC69_22800 [Polyangiaceae bacterium]|nr:hypothetical protein [Polyangiaceae bacterium]
MTHVDERPSDPPLGTPAFRDRCNWGDFAPPDLVRVAEEARWLAEPAAAVIACFPWRGGTGQGWLVTSSGMEGDDSELIQRWLGAVEASSPLPVPGQLRRRIGCHRVLAVPMRGSERLVGALALPLRPGWGPMARELENLGSDFALRLEAADQRAQRVFVRVASVGRRPAGRRDQGLATTRPLAHAVASRMPRPRPVQPEAPRRVDIGTVVLGREGASAVGRR